MFTFGKTHIIRNIRRAALALLLGVFSVGAAGQGEASLGDEHDEFEQQDEIIGKFWSMAMQFQLDEAVAYLKENEQLFKIDKDLELQFNWCCSCILTLSGKYSEARPYVTSAISYLDSFVSELDAVADSSRIQDISSYLSCYYLAPKIDFGLGGSSDAFISGLKRAKSIYETLEDTQDVFYELVVKELKRYEDVAVFAEASKKYAAKDYRQAIPLLCKAIDVTKEYTPNDHSTLASWHHLLATAYSAIGEYQNAEKSYKAALYIFESYELQGEEGYRMALSKFGALYTILRNYEKADALVSKAKVLFEEVGDSSANYVQCLSYAAVIKNRLGRKTEAKELVDKAVSFARRNFLEAEAGLYGHGSDTLDSRFFSSADKARLRQGVFVNGTVNTYVGLLTNSSEIYMGLGLDSDAELTAKEAIRISDEYDLNLGHSFYNLGLLRFRDAKFSEAADYFLKAYEVSVDHGEKVASGFMAASVLFLLNDSRSIQFSSDVSTLQRQNIQDMFAFMGSGERAIYWKHYESRFPLLNLYIFESGDPKFFGSIYDNIMESKGLLLRTSNTIRDAILSSGNEKDIADFKRIGHLKRKLQTEADDSLRSNMTSEIEMLDKRLTQNVSAYANFASAKPVSWTDVRNALGRGDVAIEFTDIPVLSGADATETSTRYSALLLKKTYKHPHIIPLCPEARLAALAPEDYYETDSVYNLIWRPLEAELKGVENIYFAADGRLHTIGIEHVQTPDGDVFEDKFNVYRLSSTRLLVEGRANRKDANAVLYGGLSYDLGKDKLIAASHSSDYHPTAANRAFTPEDGRYGVKYLPGSLTEVQNIAQTFAAAPRLYVAEAGTEESFKALAGSNVDIIHLATHGFFWTSDEAEKRSYVSFLRGGERQQQSGPDNALLRSGLLFSGANIGLRGEDLPGDVEDGVLTALELADLNLGNVDMVVMSACESGLGEVSSEGVFGLQRGFKLAGANSLLMSLWKVDDAATQILMTTFYRNYLAGKSKQESLKLAQRELRNNPKYSSPDYWAAFILLDGLN